jgi:hypothetical protein
MDYVRFFSELPRDDAAVRTPRSTFRHWIATELFRRLRTRRAAVSEYTGTVTKPQLIDGVAGENPKTEDWAPAPARFLPPLERPVPGLRDALHVCQIFSGLGGGNIGDEFIARGF